jgi:hypothetical protein
MPVVPLNTLPTAPSRIGNPTGFPSISAAFLDAMPDLQQRLNNAIIGRRWPIKHDFTGVSNFYEIPISSGVSHIDMEFISFVNAPYTNTPKSLSLSLYTAGGQHLTNNLRYTLFIGDTSNDWVGQNPVGALPILKQVAAFENQFFTRCKMYRTTSSGNSWIAEIEQFQTLNNSTPFYELSITVALMQLSGPLTKLRFTTIDNTSQSFSGGTCMMSWY